MSTLNTIESNPCYMEQALSMKCLDKNAYDHDKCEQEFENYRTCKKFWGHVQRQRRSQGITPIMPNLEERKRIKADFMNGMK